MHRNCYGPLCIPVHPPRLGVPHSISNLRLLTFLVVYRYKELPLSIACQAYANSADNEI